MHDDKPPLWSRYRDLLRRHTRDDVDDEIRFHLDMRIDEARRGGLSDEAARLVALRRFGERGTVEEELLRLNRARDKRRARTEWIADLRQDAAFAVRSLRRAPAFSIAAVATLAIAIAANTAIYSVVHALLLAPLPYVNPERLATPENWGYSSGELLALRAQLRSAAAVGAYGGLSANLDDGATAERVDAASVSANLFTLLGSTPILGRVFAPDENDPGKTSVVVLSEGLWRRRFAADSAIVGRRILVDGTPATVVGVMPGAFAFPKSKTAFWKPFTIDRVNPVSLWASAGHAFVVRLKPGMTLDAARKEIRSLAVSLRHANTMWDPGPTYGQKADLVPLQERIVGGTRPTLVLLLACAALVLLIACANVANLLLARATARARELAVRAALGGGRGRLIRQLLTESVVLSVAGGALGLLLAAVSVKWIVSTLPPSVPRASEIAMNGAALGFTATLAIFTGIAFGVLPAFRATSGQSGHDAARSGRTGHGLGHQRVSAMLVVGEVALAVLLAIGAELMVSSFRELERVDPGFRTSNIVSARITPAAASYTDPERMNAFYATVIARVAAMHGVTSVGGVSALPLATPAYSMGIRIEGQFEDAKSVLPSVDHFQTVTPGYMPTIGMQLIAGRAFTDQDRRGAEPVAIVSQSTAKHFWPDESAIGRRIAYPPANAPWITIVGIVADVRLDSLRDPNVMSAYVPFDQRLTQMGAAELTLVVRTADDPRATESAIRDIVAGVDRAVPVSDIQTMTDVVSQSVAKPRFTAILVGAFAMVAVILGVVGIYGVMGYVVSQRAQELSIRAALGATSRDILLSVLGRAATLAGVGAMMGIGAMLLFLRPLHALLYGVAASDPWSYAVVALLFVGVAIVASSGPARRAAASNPVSALRGG